MFPSHDLFADVLLGLTHSVEEMEGESLRDVTPSMSKTAAAHQPPSSLIDTDEPDENQMELFEENNINMESNDNNSGN